MLVKNIVVESSVSNCKASKFPSVSIRISARLNCSRNKPEVEELFVEVASVSAKVTDQVAHFRSDGRIGMHDQRFKVVVDVSVVDILVEVFRNSRQLGNQA